MNTHHGEGQNSTWSSSDNQTEDVPVEVGNYPLGSSESSATSYDDNNDIIEFGPIKVKPRKKPALTLATGRRSKYESLTPEEEYKREVRRARNRAAAERVKISRLNVEQELQGQIDILEDEEKVLLNSLQMLQYQKLSLETRLQTHQKACPTMNGISSAFNTQSVEQIPNINFDDLLLDSPRQLDNNYTNSLSTMIPDDIDDFFMDS